MDVSNESVEYIKQLILTSLLTLTKMEGTKLSEEKFNIELLVRCLQGSKNLQTSQHCLNLLSHAAVLFPTRLIHNIMHIFTFMGGTILRVDDEHSFTVMEKTIEAIIPVLIQVG